MTDAFLYNYLSLWATTWLWIFRVFAVESGDFFCHLNYGRKTRPSQTKKWKEILLSIQARRDQHWNPNTLPLCGPVRWSLKCCHDGLALSAQRRPTDALPRGRARGEQGSGPGASSALPRIQIGQCAVGKEGLRDTHTHTHTDHEQEGVLPAEFLHWPWWEGPSGVNAEKSSKLMNVHTFTATHTQKTWLCFMDKRFVAEPEHHVSDLFY